MREPWERMEIVWMGSTGNPNGPVDPILCRVVDAGRHSQVCSPVADV